MDSLFKPEQKSLDTRKRRRLFKFIRKLQRISLVVLIWLAGAAILYGIYNVVFLKPYFEVSNIEVKGDLKMLSTEQIIEDSGIKNGDHLLRIPVGDVQERLSNNPWVKEAAVHRKLPHMVWIYVKEYVPEAVVRSSDGWRYVDHHGVPFKVLESHDERDFPVITGLEELSLDDSSSEFRSRVLELLKVKRLFEASRIGEIYGLSEIHYDSNRGVSIITQNDPMELRLGFGPFVEKIDRLRGAYPAIRSHGGIIAYIDLNLEGKVVVKYGI